MMSIYLLLLLLLSSFASPAASQGDPQYCSSGMEVVNFGATGSINEITTLGQGFYPNRLRRCWIIAPGNSMFVTIDFEKIDTEENFDLVEVRSITWYEEMPPTVEGASAPLLTLSGAWTLEDLQANVNASRLRGEVGQAFMITLTTDSNYNSYEGFKAKVSASPRDCLSGLTLLQPQVGAQAGLPFSDGYGTYLPAMALCFVIVPPSPRAYIEINFLSFQTELHYDTVEISKIAGFDVQNRRYSGKTTVFGTFSGLALPPPVLGALGDILLVQFRSDFSVEASGFTAQASARVLPTPAPTLMPTRAHCDSGVIYNQVWLEPTFQYDFDDPSESNLLCILFVPEEGMRVSIQITQLAMGPNDFVRMVSISRDADPVQALSTPGQFTGIRRVDVSTIGTDFKRVYYGQTDQIVVAYLNTEGTSPVQRFRAMVKSAFPPTLSPTTSRPTRSPTLAPTRRATNAPNPNIEFEPTMGPTTRGTKSPTSKPSKRPTPQPTRKPSKQPTSYPTSRPTREPTSWPTRRPTREPTSWPTMLSAQ